MKIVAIKPAFYNGRRVRVGDELDIPQGLKGSWFAAVATPEAKAARLKPSTKQEPKALSEIARTDGKSFTDVHDASLA